MEVLRSAGPEISRNFVPNFSFQVFYSTLHNAAAFMNRNQGEISTLGLTAGFRQPSERPFCTLSIKFQRMWVWSARNIREEELNVQYQTGLVLLHNVSREVFGSLCSQCFVFSYGRNANCSLIQYVYISGLEDGNSKQRAMFYISVVRIFKLLYLVKNVASYQFSEPV